MNTMHSLLQHIAQYKVRLDPLPDAQGTASDIQAVLSVVFMVTGAIALMMFVIGGFRYITSQGDPQATAKAKNTLLYAIIGLVISISAVTIVTFVIGNV